MGAAFGLLGNAWQSLLSGQIALARNSNSVLSTRGGWQHVSRFWRNFLQRPLDYLLSLMFSILLFGIFVAESTGTVLSARIISDTLALVSSERCKPLTKTLMHEGFDYIRKCYGAESGQDGCNFLYNQSIAFTESSEDRCPFVERLCAFKNESIVTFDTGLLDARYLGINSPARFQFRRRSTCVPLKPDGKSLKSTLTSNRAVQYFKTGRYKQAINRSVRLGTIETK